MQVSTVGAALALLGLLGCRATVPSEVVTFWAMGREGEVVPRLLREFEQREPGIRVRVEQVPWSAAHEKLLTAYVGGVMPDLFQIGSTWIPEFVALGALEPLHGRLAVVDTDFFSGILDTNRLAGATYGVPWYVDTRLLFYRSDVLTAAGYAQPPQTWNAWLGAMQRVQARAGTGNYAILLPVSEWQTPVILALQCGATLLRDDAQYGDFESPAFRRAFAFYLELFRRGLAPRAGAAQVSNLYQDFASGYFSFYLRGPWDVGEFSRRLPARLAGRWMTAPMPGPEGAPGVSLAGGASLAVFHGSARQRAAWKVIDYLMQPQVQVEFYRLTGDLPSRRAAWADPALRANPYARAFRVQLGRVRATPKIPEWERIASLIGRYSEAAIRGDLAPADALRRLDRDTDAVLAKRRWLLRRARAGRHA